MISTRFCPVCGAANNDTQMHCFACDQLLPTSAQDEGTLLHERYRLGTTIGSGGYSAVYRAWDTQAGGRAVAIKQITLHGLGTDETIEATNTYNREVDALSALSHPQVPRLYDHFSDPDHWYLVLEYIEGQTLESYLEARAAQNKPFQIEEVLGIGLQLCTVLTYLHSRHPALIFRDLKPDNIMRTPFGKLYLIDFGIARHYIPGQSRDTQSLGSPGYAAPEQYGRAQTDARTDLYGLGALLHQLLSGRDPSETPRNLPPLRLHGQAGSADLELLVNHLLASDPQDRPASAHDLARELDRIHQKWSSALDSKRIWQPPVPQNYPITSGSQVQIQFQQQAAQQKRKRLTRRGAITAIGAGVALLGGFGVYTYAKISAQPAPIANKQTIYTYTRHASTVNSLAWSPDSQHIASASADASVQIWDALNGNNASTYFYTKSSTTVNAVAWSLNGQYILAASDSGNVELWTGGDLTNVHTISGFIGYVNTLAWAPGTDMSASPTYFATGSSDSSITIQNIKDDSSKTLTHQVGPITSIAYSPDGWYLATGSRDQSVIIWDMQTYQRIYAKYQGHSGVVTSVIWLPNGVYLASASTDQTVTIWEPTSGGTLLTYQGHSAGVNAIAASPDGHYIASASDDGTVQVWSTYDGTRLMAYTGHTAPVTSVAWSPDGNYIASGATDKTVQVWYAPTPPAS